MNFRGLVWKREWKITFFGLKSGQDLENRSAHPPPQEFPGVPPPPAENKRQRTVVWLIYHQSECQGEEFFVNFPCASENVSYFILSVSFSGPSLAPEHRGISRPAQLLGDHAFMIIYLFIYLFIYLSIYLLIYLFTAYSLPLTFEDYCLVSGQWRCIGVRHAKC